jgi:nitrogen-specific signal transduction histidine kinase
LRDQQRLESIGVLAGGVAHEINNPINGIMNYAQVIKDCSKPSSEIMDYSNEILRETDRVATIVKNLLQFSRNEKQQHSYSDIKDIVQSTASLINAIVLPTPLSA